MKYAYYPGCSLEHTAKPYDTSVRAVFRKLQVELAEIEDWNCCGATMYMSVNKLVGYAVSARNLALAQNMGCDICAPCSSCYTILRKTNRFLDGDASARGRINEALQAANLSYEKRVEVRHPLDILVNDVGLDRIVEAAPFRLNGLKVAPYYGCQIVRPIFHFDDLEEPVFMDRLFKALGATVVDYPGKVRCCGGMLMMTAEDVALDLNFNLLEDAAVNEADVIVTACPMCQMNLEAYQPKINKRYGREFKTPVLYFTQLLGMALGLDNDDDELGIESLLIPARTVKAQRKSAVAKEVAR
jgi:heterodisulfide reductase subunit B